jgi:fructokinase
VTAMRLGVDLGGTKIELIALDTAGHERLRRRVPTPQGDYEATLAAIAFLVAQSEAELGEHGTVGVGTPGAISLVDGRMKNANSTVLNGRPLKQDLERALGREVRLANDANCLALSEAVDGSGAGARATCSPGRTPSPASGATIRCPPRCRRISRPLTATAAAPAASRPTSRARG